MNRTKNIRLADMSEYAWSEFNHKVNVKSKRRLRNKLAKINRRINRGLKK